MLADTEEHDNIYRGFNPAFVRRVWQKRRKMAGRKYQPGMKRQGWSADEKSMVAEMVGRGLSCGQIALTIGRSANSVVGIVHRNPQWRQPGKDTHG